jgi:hypothetical protein
MSSNLKFGAKIAFGAALLKGSVIYFEEVNHNTYLLELDLILIELSPALMNPASVLAIKTPIFSGRSPAVSFASSANSSSTNALDNCLQILSVEFKGTRICSGANTIPVNAFMKLRDISSESNISVDIMPTTKKCNF